MKAYCAYMDSIRLTPAEHGALLSALQERGRAPEASKRKPAFLRYAALAACAVLVAAAGWRFSSPSSPVPAGPVTALPNAKVYSDPADPSASPALNDAPASPVQPPAVHLPHQEPLPSAPVEDIYSVPLAPYSTAPGQISVDVDHRAPPQSLTLAECRQDPLGLHLPGRVPARFTYESGLVSTGPNGERVLSALWSHGMEEFHISLCTAPAEQEIMEVSDPARYDVRLYALPWSDTVPEDILFSGFQDPVFRYEDLTDEVLAARALTVNDVGDTGGLRYQFSVLYGDGTLASYRIKGLTPEEVSQLFFG